MNQIKAYIYPKPAEFQQQMRNLKVPTGCNASMLEIVADEFSKATGIPRDAFTISNTPPELLVENRVRNHIADLLGSEESAERFFPTGKSNTTVAWRDVIDALAPFKWISHNGEAHDVADMATLHLYYSFRMLWNNTVPPVFRVGKFKRYNDIAGWSREYVKRAIDEISKELGTRDLDLELSDTPDTTIEEQLGDIFANLDVIDALGI